MINSPLVSFVKDMNFDVSRASGFHWDFKVSAQTVFEYVLQVIAWQRLCRLEEPDGGFNGAEYWAKHILIWDVLTENWGGEALLGFVGSGEKLFALLGVALDSDPTSDEYKEAHELCWRLLTKSSLQKITHGKGLTDSVHLGLLWDENEGADCKPGTFAELLRYGAIHFRQTREQIDVRTAPPPPQLIKKGLLEA